MRWTGSLVLALIGLPAVADDRSPDSLVHTVTGGIPIILSAPHGGGDEIPGVGERTGFAVDKFVTVRDTGTYDLTLKLCDAIEKKMGAKPFVVMAKFDRRFIDANRPAADAYEWKAAKPVYDHYHASLASAKKKVETDWGRGLLLDIHGQIAERDTIFRGTNDGKTVAHMIDRFGKAGLSGPKSVLGLMEAKGYKVFPNADSKDKENPRYGGGYIVQTYGSKDGGTVDAIQLELGWNQRMRSSWAKTSADLADAIDAYAKEYLPASPKKP
jgi:N-formylglutamate amidohydrolase